MPRVSGFLHVIEPGQPDNSLPGLSPGAPDQGLPQPPLGMWGGVAPPYPGNGLPPLPGAPDNTLPPAPPGVWPPPTVAHPIVPLPPETEVPPGTIWPSPGTPTHPIAPGGGGEPTHPIEIPSAVFWVIAGIPGIGWRYIAVDPSLKPDNTVPGASTKPV